MADDALDYRHPVTLQTVPCPQQQTPDSQVIFPSGQILLTVPVIRPCLQRPPAPRLRCTAQQSARLANSDLDNRLIAMQDTLVCASSHSWPAALAPQSADMVSVAAKAALQPGPSTQASPDCPSHAPVTSVMKYCLKVCIEPMLSSS